MVLAGLVLLAGLPEVAGRKHTYAFRAQGQVLLGIGYSHLAVETDVQALYDYAEKINRTLATMQVARRKEDSRRGNRLDSIQPTLDAFDTILTMQVDELTQELGYLEAVVLTTYDVVSDAAGRVKRGVLEFLAGTAMGSLGTACVMGIFGGTDLTAINKVLTSEQNQLDLVFEITKANAEDEALLLKRQAASDAAVRGIISLMTGVNYDVEYLKATTATSAWYNHAMHSIDNAWLGYTAATVSKRLHPRSIHPDSLKTAFSGLKAKIKAKGFQTFFTDYRVLFQLEASFVPTRTGFRVIVHVPMSTTSTVLKVYRFKELAITWHDLVVVIRPDKTNIAVTADKKEFVELTDGELAACHRVHSNFLCPNQQVLTKASAPSCLYALFMSRTDLIPQVCDLHVLQKKDFAVAFGETKFMMFSAVPGAATLICSNSSVTHVPLAGFKQVEVPRGCQLDTPHHRLVATVDPERVDTKATIYDWDINMSDLMGGLNLTTVREAVIRMDNMTKAPTHLKEIKVHLDAFERESRIARVELAKAKAAQGGLMSKLMKGVTIFAGTVCVILLLAFGYYCARKSGCLKKKTTAAAAGFTVNYVGGGPGGPVARVRNREVRAIPPDHIRQKRHERRLADLSDGEDDDFDPAAPFGNC